MSRRVPRALAACATILLIAAVAGCNLPRAAAGSRCAKVGDYAQDGTYVLKCSTAKRWVRGITTATADKALAALVAAVSNPTGALDGVAPADPGTVRVVGWALDPESPSPISVRVTVDGAVATTARAGTDRPDIQTGKPELGTAHGFDLKVPAGDGSRRVCVTALNIGRGSDATLGCRQVVVPPTVPRGTFEGITTGPSTITASGWADDPDVSGPADLRVTWRAPGIGDPTTIVATTGTSRPDLAAVGIPVDRGFRVSFPVGSAGPVEVCVIVINHGAGSDRSLGCQTTGFDDHRPQGAVDQIAATGAGVTVGGWAADPDSLTTATVTIRVDGTPTTVAADQVRNDIGAAHPQFGTHRGFSRAIGLAAGYHQVCVSVADITPSSTGLVGDRVFPCGGVIVAASSSGSIGVATSGAAVPSVGVGPAPGHPIASVDRDGGVSVTLSDGSTLWLFGDSSDPRLNAPPAYFVGNTAAWAPAATPAVTHDDWRSPPLPFLDPTADFPACPSSGDRRAEWPLSAVAQHVGSLDHVVAYVENVCVGTTTTTSRGIAVAEWFYDPSDPPDQEVSRQGIRFSMSAQVAFAGLGYGTGAVESGGLIYAYRCEGPANGGLPDAYGPCRAARVPVAEAGTVSSYRYWDGASWSSDPVDAAEMTLPDEPAGVVNPVASFTVKYDATLALYVMAYSPWPGYQSRAAVRVASSPVGPWTAPVEVELPGCNDTIGGYGYYCYAVTAQPALSTAGSLGLGYYDQAVANSPVRGQYRVTTVPFDVFVRP